MPHATRPEDTEPTIRPEHSPRRSQLTPEQRGWAIAALVAFLGIAYTGPALSRLLRGPTRKERIERRIRAARRQAQKAGNRVRKRVHQLGGGTIRR